MRLGGMARWEEADVEAFLEKAKTRRTKFGEKPEGARRPGRPGRPLIYINGKHSPKPKLDHRGNP